MLAGQMSKTVNLVENEGGNSRVTSHVKVLLIKN